MSKIVSNRFKPKSNNEAVIYAEEDLTSKVQFVINFIMNEREISKKKLAEELDVSASTVTRILDHSSNLTIRTIAKIFHALKDEPQFTSTCYEKMVFENKATPVISNASLSEEICNDMQSYFQKNFLISERMSSIRKCLIEKYQDGSNEWAVSTTNAHVLVKINESSEEVSSPKEDFDFKELMKSSYIHTSTS